MRKGNGNENGRHITPHKQDLNTIACPMCGLSLQDEKCPVCPACGWTKCSGT